MNFLWVNFRKIFHFAWPILDQCSISNICGEYIQLNLMISQMKYASSQGFCKSSEYSLELGLKTYHQLVNSRDSFFKFGPLFLKMIKLINSW